MAGSAGIGGAKVEVVEDLCNEAKSNGDLDKINNCTKGASYFPILCLRVEKLNDCRSSCV